MKKTNGYRVDVFLYTIKKKWHVHIVAATNGILEVLTDDSKQ
jgi:hypothetical protein